MRCPRCGARWRSDPECGKTIHLSLPERPADQAERRALVQVGIYANVDVEPDTRDDIEVVDEIEEARRVMAAVLPSEFLEIREEDQIDPEDRHAGTWQVWMRDGTEFAKAWEEAGYWSGRHESYEVTIETAI